MEKDKELLDGIISDFYNSVEDQFDYRLKHNWKIELTELLYIFSVGYFFLNVIPVIPGFAENYFNPVFVYVKNQFNLELGELNFWYKWGLGVIVSGLLFLAIYIPYKYWQNKDKKRAVSHLFMTFCYVFRVRKDVKSFLINDNPSHLEKCLKFFNKVSRPISRFRASNEDSTTYVPLKKLKKQMEEQLPWIKFDQKAIDMIDALSTIDTKITERLKQRVELDKIMTSLDLLTLYEFSKLKPEQEVESGVKIEERRQVYLEEFANNLSGLTAVEAKGASEDKRKRGKAKSFFQRLSNLFTNSHIVLMFISWVVLMAILFVLPTYLIIDSLNITIDSTLLIGLISAPFLMATTFTAAIYSKNKSD